MPIPADRLCEANWQAAGRLAEGGIPARATIYATIAAATYGNGSADARAGIQTELDACPSGQTVLLGAGLFRVDDYLYVRSNTTLRGSGAGVTTLRNINGGVRDNVTFANSYGNSLGLIVLGNSLFPAWQNTGLLTLTADAVKGASSVTVDSVVGLSIGQYVLVSEDQFFTGGTWNSKPLVSGAAHRFQDYKTDRVSWARNRLVGSPHAITSSEPSSNRFTLASSAYTYDTGALVYLEGHDAVIVDPAPDGLYRILDQPSANEIRLQPAAWTGVSIDITAPGGAVGTVTQNQPGEYQQAGGTVPPDSGWLTWHSRGHGHVYGETKRITGIAGLTVTFESPFCTTYRVSQLAQIAVNNTAFVEHAGVESMTLHKGSNGAIRFNAAAKCWAYNLDIYEWMGHGIHIEKSYRVHVEGCTVRYGNWRYPGGGGYCLAIYDQSAEVLVQNCILVDANKSIAVNAAGAGCVLGYSYLDDTMIYSDLGWMEAGANASHFGGSHHMLLEGNYAPNAEEDNTHGSSYGITCHRSHLAGKRALQAEGPTVDNTNRRCIGFGYGSLGMSVTGCVLGTSGGMSGWVLLNSNHSVPNNPQVYKFGYDPGNWNMAEDPNVVADFYEGDNYNYVTPGIRTAEGGSTPNSFYLAARPAWFGTETWPWVTPTDATKTYTLPAKYRWDQGQWNNLALSGPGESTLLPFRCVVTGSRV